MLTPYLKWHLVFNFIPQVIFWTIFYKRIIKYKITLLLVFVFGFIFGLIWDIIASPWWSIWHFTVVPNLNIYFLGIPLEEYLFILTVPVGIAGFVLMIRSYLYKDYAR